MKKIIIAFLGGIIMGLTPAPFNAYYLAWFALTPLWILTAKTKQVNLLLPVAWGCGYHGLALFWITGVHPMTWMGVPWLASLAIAFFCWLFITFWGVALVTLWSTAMHFIGYSYQRLILGVALWSGLEALWSATPLWWTSLSYTQSPDNLIILQLGQLSGPTTITAAIVAVNGLIAEAYLCRKNLYLYLSFLLLFSLHTGCWWMYSRPLLDQPETAIQVGIIQGNIPNEIKLNPQGWRKAIEGYTRGYLTLAENSDVILTPETALPYLWKKDNIQDSSFYQAILQAKTPAFVGAFGKRGDSFTNSVFTVDGNGEILSRFDKVKLVPLGEYIPFQSVLGKFIDRLSPLDAHLVKGEPQQIFNTPWGQATVGICYESAFAEHFRRQTLAGGEFIITASNNAHYSVTMPAQHHGQDVMRAIESDRWAARATNTGYSAVVDPRGNTLWISGVNTYELHTATIYQRQNKTLYVRWGDWLTIILLICGALSFFCV